MAWTPYRACQSLRPRAHGVQDGVGMISPEIPEHGIHRGVVPDIARAEKPKQADPGSGGETAHACR